MSNVVVPPNNNTSLYNTGNANITTTVSAGGNVVTGTTVPPNNNTGLYNIGPVAVPIGNNISITGNITAGGYISAGGNVYGANLITQGNVYAGNVIGNIVGNFILGGGNTEVVFNNNGQASSSPSFTFNPATNTVTVLGSVTATGNVSGNYFIGNGSQLTGIQGNYSNANVAAYLPTYTGNLRGGNLSVTGNVAVTTGANTWLIANQRIYTPAGGQWFSDVANLDEYINSASNGYININALHANGQVATNLHLEQTIAHIDVDGDVWTFDSTGNLTLPSNVANINYANGVSILNNVGGNYSNANVVSLLANFGSNIISTTGNITASYFIGNGSQLTGIVGNYSNANVANYLPTFSGNLTAGNVSVSGNITGGNLRSNGNVFGNAFSIPTPPGGQEKAYSYRIGNVGSQDYAELAIDGLIIYDYVNVFSNQSVAVNKSNIVIITDIGASKTSTLSGDALLTDGIVSAIGDIYTAGIVSAVGGIETSGLVSASGNIIAGNYFIGDGGLLSNINVGNITGAYSNANVANYLPTFTGNVGAGNLILTSNTGVIYTNNVTGLPGDNVTITADGTNDIHLDADSIRIGDNNQPATLTTHGTGNLILRTHEGSAAEGNIVLVNGANGNIDITTNGTGTINLNGAVRTNDGFSAVGNVSAGNIATAGLITATGNITGGNILTGGVISATGNITGGNITGINGGLLGNISVLGNIITNINSFQSNTNPNPGRILFGAGRAGNYNPTVNTTSSRMLQVDEIIKYDDGLRTAGITATLFGNLSGGNIGGSNANSRLQAAQSELVVVSGNSVNNSPFVVRAYNAALQLGFGANTNNAFVQSAAAASFFTTIIAGSSANTIIGALNGTTFNGNVANNVGFYTFAGGTSNVTGNCYGFYMPGATTSIGGQNTGNGARSATNYYFLRNDDNLAKSRLGSLELYHNFTANTATTTGTINIDKNNGQWQQIYPTGNITIGTFSNFVTRTQKPDATQVNQTDVVTLLIQQSATPFTVTMPTGNANIRYANGTSTVANTANSTTIITITGTYNYNVAGNQYLINISPEYT